MGYVAYSTFRQSVMTEVFPETEAENLVARHRQWFLNGLIEMQMKVPCLQLNHTDQIGACATYYHCGATVFDAPRGLILNLSTISTDDCCDKVGYDSATKDEIDCLIAEAVACDDIEHPYQMYYSGVQWYDYPGIDQSCFDYPGADVNKPCRARSGKFALYRGQMWVYPHIDANETILLEWDGIKREWDDADLIDDDPKLREAMAMYMLMMVAWRDDHDTSDYALAKTQYDDKVADMIWVCGREQRLLTPRKGCLNNCG